MTSTGMIDVGNLPKGDIAKRFAAKVEEFRGVRSRGVSLTRFATPTIFTEENWDENADMPINWQSTVADGINNISSKFTMNILTPGSSPIEFGIKGSVMQQLHQQNPKAIPVLRAALAAEAQTAHQHMMDSNIWTATFANLQLASASGNSLIYQDDDLNFSVYNMWNFHVHRKMSGLEHEILVRDWLQFEDMKQEWQDKITGALEVDQLKKILDADAPFPVVGKIRHQGGTKWKVTRECVGVELETAEWNGTSSGPTPYASFMWEWVPGKHYGRSLLETMFGDIRVHDGQSRSITEGAAASSRVIPFLSPDAITHIDDLDENNGRIITGRADDLTFASLARSLNLDWAIAHNAEVRERLDRVFMNDVALFPTGERVTATHIMKLQEALRERHGGVSAMLAKYQKPVFARSVYNMQKKKWMSQQIKLSGENAPFELRVKTSADPFGRGDDMNRYMTFTQLANGLGKSGEEALNSRGILHDAAGILGLDARALITSNEQAQAQVQQQAQQEQQAAAGQEAIRVQGAVAEDQATGQQAPPQ